jgi:hypothetical protein
MRAVDGPDCFVVSDRLLPKDFAWASRFGAFYLLRIALFANYKDSRFGWQYLLHV